ncbi:MAG: efflux RND transporter periplasmic adaptor subunit [Hahellaceae bacterium]|jgi:multidrug efflux system membrane fusion protein|nr:efflux RND transporter periplasmic adaptor subunit [Hahellaceae bacterium]
MNKSIIIACVLTVVAVAWLITGNIYGPNSIPLADNTTTDTAKKPLFRVEATLSTAQVIDDVVLLNGQIESAKNVELKSEIDGSITALFFKKGDRVKQGDLIATINVGDRQEQLQKAKADLAARESDIRATESLKAKKLISDNQYQQDLANVAAARAAVKDIEVQIANTHIRAPFTGLINQLPVEVGDFASKNTHVATVIDDSRVKISVQVPQQHITKLRKGSTMQAELLNGTTYNGTIDYLSAQANANTRTFTVEASAPLNGAPAFFGQSANIEINVGEELAHKLSPATLDLDTAGNLQVKLLNNDNIVVAHAVEIIRSERDGLWLKGLPAEITVITSGQGFVTPGQQVEVIPSPARVDNSSAANAKPAAQRHSS